VSRYVIMELIDTEKDYVRDLGLVVEVCNLFTVSSWILNLVVTARSELWKVLFLATSVCGLLFVYEISREPLNRFASSSHGRRVWSLAWTSLKVKVKDQGHQGQKNGIFWPFRWHACGLCLVICL